MATTEFLNVGATAKELGISVRAARSVGDPVAVPRPVCGLPLSRVSSNEE